MCEYQNTKMFLKKSTLQLGTCNKESKTTVPWICVIDVFNNEENVGTFYEKDLQKASRVAFRIEKVIKRKGDRL